MKTYLRECMIVCIVLVSLALIPIGSAQESGPWQMIKNDNLQSKSYQIQHPPKTRIVYPDMLEPGVVYPKIMRIVDEQDKTLCDVRVAEIQSGSVIEQYKRTTEGFQMEIMTQIGDLCPSPNKPYSPEEFLKKINWQPVTIDGVKGLQAASTEDPCLAQYLPISLLVLDDARIYICWFKGLATANEYHDILATLRFYRKGALSNN